MTKELEKKIYLKAVLISLIFVAIGVLFGFYKFAAGIVIGTITGIINFRLLAIKTSIITSFRKTPNPFIIIGNLLFRFLIMGAVLWIAINRGIAVFAGASTGLFMVTFAIYANSFSIKAKSKEESV